MNYGFMLTRGGATTSTEASVLESMSTSTEMATADAFVDNNSSNNSLFLGFGNPEEAILKLLVKACSEANRASREEEGWWESGNVGAILATAGVCYGAHLVDCAVVRLYRWMKRWEWQMDDEEKGNIKSHLMSGKMNTKRYEKLKITILKSHKKFQFWGCFWPLFSKEKLF